MGLEHGWTNEEIFAYVRGQAQDYFDSILNTFGVSWKSTTIRDLQEIVPSTLKACARWPDRAWSVIGVIEEEHKSVGVLLGAWYDSGHLVDLVNYDLLAGAVGSPVEELHRELLETFNSYAEPHKKPMSHAARVRLSKVLDYRGRYVGPSFQVLRRSVERQKKENRHDESQD